MSVALLETSPLVLPSDLGPYRAADYWALPDEPRCELLYGRFYVSPSPVSLHQLLVGLLFRQLARIADATAGDAFVAPLDIPLADHSVVQPDVVYFGATKRGGIYPKVTAVPDLVVEVLSPGTSRRDRGEKLKLYAESGVAEYWIADAELKTLEILVNRKGRFEVMLAEGGHYASPVNVGVTLDLETLWTAFEARMAP